MPITSIKPRHRQRPAAKRTVVADVAALAWAGRHALAIESATAALATRIALPDRLDLLDLRAESRIAAGDIAAAAADAQLMLDAAKRSRNGVVIKPERVVAPTRVKGAS